MGKLSYRGYFDEEMAMRASEKLRSKGFDVYLAGIDAYSTLGWFNDPVLSTFVDYRESALAELIFHELTHKRLYLPGETEFNEALATAVAQEGVRRWLKAKGDEEALRRYEEEVEERHALHRRVRGARGELSKLYDRTEGEGGPGSEVLREKKGAILEKLRTEIEQSARRRKVGGGALRWAETDLNNAKLNAVSTYYELVPKFEELLERNDGDINRFFEAAAKLPREER